MKAILTWFREHRISTHGIALAIGSLAILVETDRHVRDLFLKDLDIHPKIISSLAALGAILLAYKQPRRETATPPPEEKPEKGRIRNGEERS